MVDVERLEELKSSIQRKETFLKELEVANSKTSKKAEMPIEILPEILDEKISRENL